VELQKKGGSADGRRKLVKAELIKWCAKLECIQRLLDVMRKGPRSIFFFQQRVHPRQQRLTPFAMRTSIDFELNPNQRRTMLVGRLRGMMRQMNRQAHDKDGRNTPRST
jgi:hypothetical protein